VLGSDIIGFQTTQDAANFVECVRTLLHAEVDARRRVNYRRHSTRIGVYPVGVDWENATVRSTPPADVCRSNVRRDFDLSDSVYLGVGVDRLDYTKGLNEKFLAIERALEWYPSLRGRFAFVQVAEPSRECLPAYLDARTKLRETVARVNGRFATTSYTPIRLLEVHLDAADVYRLYRAADLCYVGSLHDGMNLVAKEFVAARHDERGVLVLSEFAGAAQQLRTAVLINPYAIDDTAEALASACGMSEAEQCARMRLMRASVRACDARWWAGRLLTDAGRIRGKVTKAVEPVFAA
jgi:trehalose 6-phosphate synthase